MLKYLTAVLIVVLAVGVAYAQQEKKEEKKPLPRIVVAGFANKTGSSEFDWVGYGLNVSLTRRLLRVKGLVTMDTASYERTRKELGFQHKGLSRRKEALKLGKALGVDKVVIGEYGKAPTGVKVVVQFLSTATGEAAGKKITVAGPALSVSAALALEVAKQLGAQIGEKAAVTKNLTENARAYESYGKGLQYKESEETYEEAIEHFIEAAKADEKFAAAHFELGWLFVVTGPRMYRAAIRKYRKAVRLYPRYAQAHHSLGALYWQLKEDMRALKALRKAVEIIPNYASAHASLGRLYHSMDNYDKAIAEYRKATELNPNDALVHNNLGAALLNTAKYDEAFNEYVAALKLDPELKDAHLGLAMVFDQKGDKELAVRHYQRFLDLGGENDDVRERLKELKKKESR